MKKIIVVIPTYNEAANIASISEALLGLGIEGLEILFVDDASPDGTGEQAETLVHQYPGRINVMHRAGKLGLGTAYIQGFRWAIGQNAGLIIQMDADFSHSPDYIPELLKWTGAYDVVVGSRYAIKWLDETGAGRWLLMVG
jgi:dolichol-phosphate mannosyltransferase